MPQPTGSIFRKHGIRTARNVRALSSVRPCPCERLGPHGERRCSGRDSRGHRLSGRFGNHGQAGADGAAVRKQALEHGVGEIENASGTFPHVSGLAFSFDASRPKGGRVVEVAIGGTPPEDRRTCTPATDDFLARGGDRYAMFEEAERRIDAKDVSFMDAQVMEFVKTADTVSPAIEATGFTHLFPLGRCCMPPPAPACPDPGAHSTGYVMGCHVLSCAGSAWRGRTGPAAVVSPGVV